MRRLAAIGTIASIVATVPPTAGAIPTEPTVAWSVERSLAVADVAIAPDGRTYAVGTVERRIDGNDTKLMWIGAFDPSGALLWSDAWGLPRVDYGGGERLFTIGTQVALGRGGSVYAAGELSGGLCGSWYLRKYSTAGELRWHRHQQGARRCSNADAPTGLAVGRTSVVLGGVTISDGFGSHAGWLEIFRPGGAPVATRSFTVPEVGADWIEQVGDVAIGRGSRILVGGAIAPPRVLQGRAGFEAVVQARTSNGRVIWTRRFPDDRALDFDLVTGVGTIGRHVVASGVFQSSGRRQEAWVARLSADGRTRWQRLEEVDRLGFVVDVDRLPGGGVVAGWHERRPGGGRRAVLTALTGGGDRAWRTRPWSASSAARRFEFQELDAGAAGIAVAVSIDGQAGPNLTSSVVVLAF